MSLKEVIETATSLAESTPQTVVVWANGSGGFGYCPTSYFLSTNTGETLPCICTVDPDGTVTYNERLTAPVTISATLPEGLEAQL